MCICTVCGGSIVTHSVQTVFLLCSGLLDTPQSLAQLLTPHRHLLSADLNTKVIRLCCSQQTLYNTNTKHVATTTLNIVFDILFLNSIMPSKKHLVLETQRKIPTSVIYFSRRVDEGFLHICGSLLFFKDSRSRRNLLNHYSITLHLTQNREFELNERRDKVRCFIKIC